MNTIKKISAKHLLLTIMFCLPFVLFLNLQNASVVTVHADYPSSVVAGTTIPITITIEKGNLNGFGRFTSTLPEGFTATCDLQNFEFTDNTIKILWVNIPYSNSFSFIINISIPETYSGNFMLNGKFGYVIDNERRFAELIPDNITVVNDPIAMRKALAQQNLSNAPVDLNEISCYRTVNIVNNEAIVSLRVNKSNIKTMCKIEEMLPDGYVFHAIERENADFSSFKNIARFMWLKAPQQNIYNVSYKVIPNPGYSIKDLYINGAFSFIDNNNTYSVVILDKDMRALSESDAKPAFETNLQESYNSNINSNLSQNNTVTSNPSATNYSSRANYDINSQNINSDLQSNRPISTSNTNQNNTLSNTPHPISSNSQSNDYIELSNDLKSKNYNQNQIDFFTTSAINSTAQPFTNTPSYSDEVGTNLKQSKSSQLPSNTNTTVNINAIPAPSTYFPTQQYNTDDPDYVSPSTNASYNRNMENTGLIGTNSVNPSNNATTTNTYPKSTPAQVTTQGYTTNSNYAVNPKSNTGSLPSNNNTNAIASNNSTKAPKSSNNTNLSTQPSTASPVSTTNKPKNEINSQPTQAQISEFENNINIPAPTVNQSKTGNYTQQNTTLPANATVTQNISKYPQTSNQPVQTLTQKTSTSPTSNTSNASIELNNQQIPNQSTNTPITSNTNKVNPTATYNTNGAQTNPTTIQNNKVTTSSTTSNIQVNSSNKPVASTPTSNYNQANTNKISPTATYNTNSVQTKPTTIQNNTVTASTTTSNIQANGSSKPINTTSSYNQTNTNKVVPTATYNSNGVQTKPTSIQNNPTTSSASNTQVNGSSKPVTTSPNTSNTQATNTNKVNPNATYNTNGVQTKPITTQNNSTNSGISSNENEYITYNNNSPVTQTIIKDENHNKLSINNISTTEPKLSNKDNFSQNETKITQFTEQNGKSNVYFRIQISAGHSMVNTKHYFKKLQIRDNIIVEEIAGWFKYTVEKFESYITARSHRNNIWNNTTIKDAFVVAYNGRNRITVQEALMITNQKWVQ